MAKDNRRRADPGIGLAIVLGSGLGGTSDEFATGTAVAFEEIPGLAESAIGGQEGSIRHGVIGNTPCLFVCGRKHYYEGDVAQIERLVAYLADQGVARLLLTSAAGSLRSALPPGRLVLVDDLVDLQFRPMRGRGASPAGRPTGHRTPFDTAMRTGLETAARRCGVPLSRGVVACLPGSAYETAAEIRALDRMGVDVVTMSGAPEIAIARAFGIQVAMITLITNWSTGISGDPLTHEEVLAVGRDAVAHLGPLIVRFAGEAT